MAVEKLYVVFGACVSVNSDNFVYNIQLFIFSCSKISKIHCGEKYNLVLSII